MTGRVSVVIPTLNRPVLLSQAIKSVLVQTVPAHEIIIVDDCSALQASPLTAQVQYALHKVIRSRFSGSSTRQPLGCAIPSSEQG